MQRTRKRLWTATVVTVASLLIALAVLIGGVRLLDLAAPGYREKLASLVSNRAGRRVTIEHMGLGWQGLRPRLELSGVVVLTQDGSAQIFAARELVIPFSWLGFMQGEALPVAVTARGLTLGLEWRADGSIGIRDLSQERAASAPLDLDEIAAFASRLERVLIEDSTVEWLEPGGVRSRRQLTGIRARLEAQPQFYTLHLTAQLPPDWGESVMLQAEAAGDLRHLEKVQTHAIVALDGLLPQYWLAPYLRPDLALRGGAVEMELRADAEGFALKQAEIEMAAAEAEAWPRAADAKAALFKLPGPSAAAQLTTVADGWDLNLARLQYGAGRASQGKLSYRPSDDGFGSRLEGQVDRLDLAVLSGWLAVLAPAQKLALPGTGAAGELTQLKFNYQERPDAPRQYLLEFDASGVSLPATEQRPGFTNLGGKVTASEAGGRFELHGRKASASVPKVFAAPIPLSEFDGLIRWARETDAWAVSGDQLQWREATLNAEGKFFLRLFDTGTSPYVDIALDYSGSDVLPAVALIPLPPALPKDVGDWLRAAIRSGRVPRGRMEMRGTLADFPYANPGEEGRFVVELDAEDASIEYAPGWPKVEQVKGRVSIQGRSLRVEGSRGQILGVPIGQTVAEIPDFLKPELLIRGTVQADVSDQLKFLQASPLREDYAGLLSSLTISGPGKLDLDLRLPLDDLERFSLLGRVDVTQGQIRYRGLDQPLTEVVGRVEFDRQGLRAEQLDGKLLGLPFSASLQPQTQDRRHYTQLEAVLPLTLPRDAAALAPLVDAGYLAPLQGSTLLRLRSLLDISASAAALELSSDLQGMAVNLGTPFGKSADSSWPLQVAVRPAEKHTRVEVNYGASVYALLKFMPGGGSWGFERGVIKLGTDPAPVLLSQAGLLITGKLPELDLRGIKFQSPALAADSELKLRGGELEVGLLHVAGQQLRNVGFQITPTAAGWQLKLGGQDAVGMIDWIKTGRGRVHAKLEKLVLQPPKTIAEPEQKQPETPKTALDPGKLPGFLLEVNQIKLGGLILGRLRFNAPAIDHGLQLQALQLGGKNFQISGNGDWTRRNEASSARLKMNINGTNIRRVLKAAGFAPSVETEQAKVGIDVNWAANPAGLSRESLNGVLALDLRNGALLDVDPGAGRVLGLLSFYSLPRRLTLDFRDVLGEGTQFDRLSGNFTIKDGVATTHDLKVDSPSVKIAVVGDVDLAERTYDQTVTIHPEVSSGVAIAGALAWGAGLGVALFLAQKIFGEPFEDIAALSYHLGGTWKDPEVKPLSAQKRDDKTKPKPQSDQAAPPAPPAAPTPNRPKPPARP